MRGFASGLVAGALLMAATKLIASPTILGLVDGARTGPGQDVAIQRIDLTRMQRVDRTHKGDRLDATERVIFKRERLPAREPEQILTGCEPVISPLSVSASASNFPRRCVVQREGFSAAG